MLTVQELLERIRKGPGMYIGSPSILRLAFFLRGYQMGLYEHDPAHPDHFLTAFRDWLLTKFPGSSRSWEDNIRSQVMGIREDERAFDLFWKYFDEFVREQELAASSRSNGVALPRTPSETVVR